MPLRQRPVRALLADADEVLRLTQAGHGDVEELRRKGNATRVLHLQVDRPSEPFNRLQQTGREPRGMSWKPMEIVGFSERNASTPIKTHGKRMKTGSKQAPRWRARLRALFDEALEPLLVRDVHVTQERHLVGHQIASKITIIILKSCRHVLKKGRKR